MHVIIHQDLDAFYAQVEHQRHPELDGKPLAVQQWRGLIAVDYACRAAGVTRFMNMDEAKRVCPDIQFVHVDIVHDKVSLEPYRRASRAIMSIFEEFGICERASVDEAYLDVTKEVHRRRQQCPLNLDDIRAARYASDLTEKELVLGALASTHVIGFSEDLILNGWEPLTDGDWLLLEGAHIAAQIRVAVFNRLGYTVSAGVGHSKLFAKIGSALNKPCQQTLITELAGPAFLAEMPLLKVPLFHGKLGHTLIDAATQSRVLETTSSKEIAVKDCITLPITFLCRHFGTETANWIHNFLRGIDTRIVEPKGPSRSLLEAKSTTNPMTTYESLATLVLQLSTGLAERVLEDHDRNGRWPKSLNVQFRKTKLTGGGDASRSCRRFPMLCREDVQRKYSELLKIHEETSSCSSNKTENNKITSYSKEMFSVCRSLSSSIEDEPMTATSPNHQYVNVQNEHGFVRDNIMLSTGDDKQDLWRTAQSVVLGTNISGNVMATLRESLGGKAFAINRVAVSVQYNVTQTDTEIRTGKQRQLDMLFQKKRPNAANSDNFQSVVAHKSPPDLCIQNNDSATLPSLATTFAEPEFPSTRTNLDKIDKGAVMMHGANSKNINVGSRVVQTSDWTVKNDPLQLLRQTEKHYSSKKFSLKESSVLTITPADMSISCNTSRRDKDIPLNSNFDTSLDFPDITGNIEQFNNQNYIEKLRETADGASRNLFDQCKSLGKTSKPRAVSFVACPICNIEVPSSSADYHVNRHFPDTDSIETTSSASDQSRKRKKKSISGKVHPKSQSLAKVKPISEFFSPEANTRERKL